MKNLLLFAALGVLGYFAFLRGCPPPPPPPPPPEQPTSRPNVAEAADEFFVYSRVIIMYEEWKSRESAQAGDNKQHARFVDMSAVLTDIRAWLSEHPRYKIHEPKKIEEVISIALRRPIRRLDVPPSQIPHVLQGLLSEANKDGKKK